MNEERIEAAAKAIYGEDTWPTNEELGGGPTGTRDDEVHDMFCDDARDALAAADRVDNLLGIHRIKIDDDAVVRVFGLVSSIRALWDDRGLDASDYPSVKDEAKEALLQALKGLES